MSSTVCSVQPAPKTKNAYIHDSALIKSMKYDV